MNGKSYLKRISSLNVATGSEGEVYLDDDYLYLYSNGIWRLSAFSVSLEDIPLEVTDFDKLGIMDGLTCYNEEHFFIYKNGWKCIAFSPIDPTFKFKRTYSVKTPIDKLKIIKGPIYAVTTGVDGRITFDEQYFYIYAGDIWRKFAIAESRLI